MRNSTLVRWLVAALALPTAGMSGATAARAATFSADTFFTAQDRSVWSGGAGFSLDTGPRFLGTSWDIGKTIGGIKEVCVLFACADFGAEIGARTNGKLGIDYSLKVDSGTFNLQLPGRATFTTPDTRSGSTVGDITVGSSFTAVAGGLSVPTAPNGPSVVRLPSLQVTGPTAQASLGLEAKVDAFAGAKACVVACVGPALGPLGFDKSQSIATVNLNNDHKITLLGNSVSANQSVSGFGGLLNASFNIPNLNSSSATTPGGFNGGTLTSTKRDSVAVVNANIAQIAADAVGFPYPLSGNLGPFGYNLLQSNAGAALDVQQSISFTPNVTGSYLFSSAVIPVVNGVAGALTSEIDFKFGDNVTFRPGQVASISYLPVINLDGVVRNETDLVIGGNIDVKALGVNVAGLSLGPLIDTRLASTDVGRISLFDESFAERLGSIKAAPITLDFAGCTVPRTVRSGEFSSTIYYTCASSAYTAAGPYSDADGTSFDYISTDFCEERDPNRPPFGLSPCGFVPDVDRTSDYVANGRRGPTYLSLPDALSYSPVVTTPSTTDATQLAALASLGYTGPPLGDPSSFLIPHGDSLEVLVDEPPPLGIVLIGGIATIGLVRRKRSRLVATSPITYEPQLRADVSLLVAGHGSRVLWHADRAHPHVQQARHGREP